MLIDSKGTQDMVWTSLGGQAPGGGRFTTTRYARKPKGAKRFSQVTLPAGIYDAQDPLLYQVSPGVLRILVTGEASKEGPGGGTYAWGSSNDGKSWTVMNTSALNDPTLRTDGTYINESNMTVVPGGPVTATGADGTGPAIQLDSDVDGWKTIATVSEAMEGLPRFARSLSGTLYMTSYGPTAGKLPFQIGSNTNGQMSVPNCTSGFTEVRLAAGRSVGVVAMSGCGHVWVRSISPAGKVGRLIRLGAINEDAFMSVVADRAGHFTVAWVEPGNDLATARSSDGAHWKISRGAVPIANLGGAGMLSNGQVSWYTFSRGDSESSGYPNTVAAIALSDTYVPPKAPPAHGISHPRRGHLGSYAVVVPGKIGLKGFRKTGRVKVRLVDTYAEKVLVSVGDSRVKGETTYDICDGSRTVKLKAHRVTTVTVTCAAYTGIVLARPRVLRPSPAKIDAHKGDTVSFAFSGRNGALTLTGKVS
jgi:hypothetical protein